MSKRISDSMGREEIFKSRFVQGASGVPTLKDRNRARLKKKKKKKKHTKKKHVYKRTRKRSNKFRKNKSTRRKKIGGSGSGDFDGIGDIEEAISYESDGGDGGDRDYEYSLPQSTHFSRDLRGFLSRPEGQVALEAAYAALNTRFPPEIEQPPAPPLIATEPEPVTTSDERMAGQLQNQYDEENLARRALAESREVTDAELAQRMAQEEPEPGSGQLGLPPVVMAYPLEEQERRIDAIGRMEMTPRTNLLSILSALKEDGSLTQDTYDTLKLVLSNCEEAKLDRLNRAKKTRDTLALMPVKYNSKGERFTPLEYAIKRHLRLAEKSVISIKDVKDFIDTKSPNPNFIYSELIRIGKITPPPGYEARLDLIVVNPWFQQLVGNSGFRQLLEINPQLFATLNEKWIQGLE